MTTTTTTTITIKTATMTQGMGTVPFPRSGGGKTPLATAPLNDTINAINTPMMTTTTTSKTGHHHNAERAVGEGRPRYRSSNNITATSQTKKVQQVHNRRSYGNEIRRQQQQQVETGGSGLNTPDYTTGSDTGGRNGGGVRPTTFEFPSYESFHKLRGTSREVKPSGVGGVAQRPFVAQRAVRVRKDSSEDDEEEEEVRDRSRPSVYARRPVVVDRPRPRSAHFGDLRVTAANDDDEDSLSFQRRHEVEHRLRRQSTRQSIELGRLQMREKDDEIKPAVAISTTTKLGTGIPSSSTAATAAGGRFTGESVSVEGGLTRRQSEMASNRLRDDVIEAKVVLLGSQGVGKSSLAKRFTQGSFSPQSATVNASLFTTKSVHDGVGVRLQIWDTCGEGAHAALILYDISDPQSFEDVRDWIHELRAVSEETDIFVVGAKYDLAKMGKRRVARRYARWKLAEWLGVRTGEDLRYLSTLDGARDGIKAEVEVDRPLRSGRQIMARSQTQSTLSFPSATTTTTTTTSNTANPISPTVTSPLSPSATSATARPSGYRFLSLLSIPTSRSSTSALLIEDDESDALASSITLQPGSRFTSGQRANSTSSATALMAMSVTSPVTAHTPTTTFAATMHTHKLPTSGSTSGLNLMSATSSSIGMPRRKSEDWSMNKAKDEFLRALGNTTTQQEESEAAKALRRTSGELLRPFSADIADSRTVSGKGEVVEYAVDDESGWGKLIVGTNVRIGETSSKTGKGVIEVFASLTSQLVLKRRQIRIEQARRAREVVDLSAAASSSSGIQASGKGKTRMMKTANCCT
ncbi:hypothetical protein QFC21_005286 [Naganishia friedmannii]|uniref:Uncharacterized protein n=1 Tax=Naganishia friedmannii TaxID=89922 RepID=A0ACC2VBW1_9TREE|nr:hypothetical protein QFC21_005286 [Naganishia friedmannii]